jgi:hypothetical protein
MPHPSYKKIHQKIKFMAIHNIGQYSAKYKQYLTRYWMKSKIPYLSHSTANSKQCNLGQGNNLV